MTTSLSQLPAVDNPSIGFRLWTGLDEVPGMAAANNAPPDPHPASSSRSTSRA